MNEANRDYQQLFDNAPEEVIMRLEEIENSIEFTEQCREALIRIMPDLEIPILAIATEFAKHVAKHAVAEYELEKAGYAQKQVKRLREIYRQKHKL